MTSEKKSDHGKGKSDVTSEQADEKSMTQTDKPWLHNPQNVTDPSLPDSPKPDLEKWQQSDTH